MFLRCLGVNACRCFIFLSPLECFVWFPTFLCCVENTERFTRTEISHDCFCVSQNVTVQRCEFIYIYIRLPEPFVSTSCLVATCQTIGQFEKHSRKKKCRFLELEKPMCRCLLFYVLIPSNVY